MGISLLFPISPGYYSSPKRNRKQCVCIMVYVKMMKVGLYSMHSRVKLLLLNAFSCKCFFFISEDWRYRHAGLMAISAVGEGCYKQMETLLPDIVNTVLPFLADQHPRVRYAACNAVGQLSTDFAPGFQKKFHTRVSKHLKDLDN